MTSYVPPIKNGASGWIGYVSLAPRTATGAWQSNPTLATGDVKVGLDGGALANLGTLPAVTPASSKLVKITLSQAEVNADNVAIIFSDAAGAEWCDLTLNLQTVARQIDDLATPTNITAGTITTVTNLTNAPTAGDLTATMKTSVTTAATAATPIAASVAGNVVGSVGSVVGLTASNVGAIKTKTDSLTFTKAGEVDANIQSVNDVTVNGVGSAAVPWGP